MASDVTFLWLVFLNFSVVWRWTWRSCDLYFLTFWLHGVGCNVSVTCLFLLFGCMVLDVTFLWLVFLNFLVVWRWIDCKVRNFDSDNLRPLDDALLLCDIPNSESCLGRLFTIVRQFWRRWFVFRDRSSWSRGSVLEYQPDYDSQTSTDSILRFLNLVSYF